MWVDPKDAWMDAKKVVMMVASMVDLLVALMVEW